MRDFMEYRFRSMVLCLIPSDLRLLNQSATASFNVNRLTEVEEDSPSHGNVNPIPALISDSTLLTIANRSLADTLLFVLRGTCFSFLSLLSYQSTLAYHDSLRFLSVAIANSFYAESQSEGLSRSVLRQDLHPHQNAVLL
jgi:hypothetical protein